MKIHSKYKIIFLAISLFVFSFNFVLAENAIIQEDGALPPPIQSNLSSTPIQSFSPLFTPSTTRSPTPIIIADSGNPARVPTGPGEAAMLALVMSLIASLLYVGYSYTPAYRRHEAEMYAKEGSREGKNIDFKS